MIDWHAANGDSAAATGAALTNFITIAGRMTRKPYGDYGAYAPWRGLRGEMLMQTGRATVIVGLLNPVVEGLQWRLSPCTKTPINVMPTPAAAQMGMASTRQIARRHTRITLTVCARFGLLVWSGR
jgi:hypothetical protein